MNTAPPRNRQIGERRPPLRCVARERGRGEARSIAWTALGLALVAATAMLASLLVPAAQAATGIQRCLSADGTPIYTDKPCSLLGAQRTPISGELLSRIAREQQAAAAATGVDLIKGATPPAVARRSAASGCARTATQLTMDLQGSWALGDVNRVAESYHWVGVGHRRAQQLMKQLDRLASQKLLQAEYFDASIGSGTMQLAEAGGPGSGAAGVLQLMLSDGGATSVQDFDVQRYSGCYFIRF